MGIAHRVRDCPRDETEWQKASNRLNCTSGVLSTKNKYHCLPADNLTTLLEFCYSRTRTQVVEGTLAVISTKIYIHYTIHSDLCRLSIHNFTLYNALKKKNFTR